MEDVGPDVGSKPLRKIITFNINRIDKKLAERQRISESNPEHPDNTVFIALSVFLATKYCYK